MLNRYIDDRFGSFEEVQVNLREDIEKVHPDLIIIDYLQLLVLLEENNKRGIAKVTSFLMRLAADYEVPVIVLSQLNRDLEHDSDKSTLTATVKWERAKFKFYEEE